MLCLVLVTALKGTAFLMSTGQWCVHCQDIVKDTCCTGDALQCEEDGCCNPIHNDERSDGWAGDLDPGGGEGAASGDGGNFG